MEQLRSSSQLELGLGPVILPSRRGSLSEPFVNELAWQAHLVGDPSLLATLIDRPIDEIEPSPHLGGLRPDLRLAVDGLEILVELQMAAADVRHLGQVVRYQAAGADYVLWLAEEVPLDYPAYVTALNRLDGARVGLAEVTTLRVAGGWAFDARLVAGELPATGQSQAETSPPTNRQRQYERFWTLLFQRAEEQGLGLFGGSRPTRQPWLRKPWRPGSGLYYSIHPAAGRVRVALVVSPSSAAYGEEVFAALTEHSDAIEGGLAGGRLAWDSADNGGRIEATVRGGYALETDRAVDVAVQLLQRMSNVFDPILESLPLNLLSQVADEPQLSLF